MVADSGRVARIVVAPELMIEARSPEHAQRAANLITAALAVRDGVVYVDELTPDPNHPFLGGAEHLQSDSVGDAAQIAALASRRRSTMYSLVRLFLSFRCLGVHWIDLHPQWGRRFPVSGDPFVFSLLAQALLAASGAIEELGLKIPAGSKRPSMIDGKWNPEVLTDLHASLIRAGIDPSYTVTWLVRGGNSRIMRQRPPPVGPRAQWARFDCRDREIAVADAIQYAEWLRSKTCAHRFSGLTRSLSLHDAANVQYLARDLLFEAIGFDPLAKARKAKRAAQSGGPPAG
jgi:hypothetical protein